MRTTWRKAAALSLAFAWAAGASAADFELTPAEVARVDAREIVIRAALDPGQRRGTVRAAFRVAAPSDLVFGMMTRCADALEYVPHLRVCRVRDRAPDDSWQLVEHEIDFGWYAPRVRYVFRADFVPGRSIAFRQVTGDFKANEGRWEFEPLPDGQTLVRYRVRLDPPGHVPNWLARSTFKRELPKMLADFRLRCEAEQSARTRERASPN